MIEIKHNFDSSKFMWLWAKYVKAGNIDKHCTGCLIGPYSKRFSGTINKELLRQPIIKMDEYEDYDAIYFCGVLKKGYLNKNPEKNNYRHNVHFIVLPQLGNSDIWEFENWKVTINNGTLERIPKTFELDDSLFNYPYNSHYFTCRIFRWMVGHFYPKLIKSTIKLENDREIEIPKVQYLIELGYDVATKKFMNDSDYKSYLIENKILKEETIPEKMTRSRLFRPDYFSRVKFINFVMQDIFFESVDNRYGLSNRDMKKILEIGVNEMLDQYFPYYPR